MSESFAHTGQWARHFDRCTECGRDDLPHAGKGLCERCRSRAYQRGWRPRWYQANRDRILEQRKKRAGRTVVCADCKRSCRHHALGLCNACYLARRAQKGTGQG